jgi:hypothetical protein
MRPYADLESSIHTNAPTPQLRKKRIMRMKRKKARSMVIRQGEGHKVKDEQEIRQREKLAEKKQDNQGGGTTPKDEQSSLGPL